MTTNGTLGTALLLLIGLSSGQALAHSNRIVVDQSGVAIPFVTHGEMAVLADFSGRITALAQSVKQPDNDFRRLVRYEGLQRAACVWGLMPASISDEESPFNECSHAYLAASKELLFRMRTIDSVSTEASALVSEIDAIVTAKGAAFIGCLYSGEGFNTAELLRPHWIHLTSHLPSLASVLGFFVLPPGIAALGSRLIRRRARVAATA